MSQVVIENPIINSPFEEPSRHFRFTDEGITDEVVEGRRISSYFVPIARPKKKKGAENQLMFDTEWTQDRIEENKLVNDIRRRVALWRSGGYVGVTPTTAKLIAYWTDPNREKKLFFCQNEALETAIYITEVAKKYGDAWIENAVRDGNNTSNPGLPRTTFKMATGSGKTVVMAMLIAWHTLNKRANPHDVRFSDTFLIVTPGITIRDRLRVLLPNDPQNYYRQRDIIPADLQEQLGQAKILITNYHAFQLREKIAAGKITKSILADGQPGLFTETPDQMVRRVCRELGNKKNIIVINDEAHHCYRRKPDALEETLSGDDRIEAKNREEEARIWISGIEAVKAKIGLKAVYDLSATPFFLRGSGYPEGTLFPWVVSDFSLIDAIEAGIVKVPRVPVADNSMTGEQPTYRDLWLSIREHLPRKGRKTEAVNGEPQPPKELQGALYSLYGNYEKYYRLWEQNTEARARGITPPVFIVVCNNTNVSKLVCDFIAGWEKQIGDQTVVQAGQLPIFRNDDGNGAWLNRPNTILVDSQQLESGEAMSADFKKIASREIEEFKAEYRVRFPGRDAENLTDEDLLREVMNTVGKAGKLGEHVKCVVSVSMLTEGWDAQTVTHILGVRAFGTQLLCEQVVGRALRRMSYAANDQGRFEPEYAEVYGVPFSFIPCSGATTDPKPGPMPTRVRALENRSACEITFPRLQGYRYDIACEEFIRRLSEIKVADLNLTFPEILSLYFIKGHARLYRGTDIEANIERAFGKLDAFLPEGFAAQLEKVKELFLTADKLTKDYTGKEETIEKLTDAVLRQKTCRIEYHSYSSGKVSRFDIHPLKLFEWNGGLYLSAFLPEYDNIRTLAVERFNAISVTEEDFSYPANFNPEEILEDAFGIIYDDPVEVKIRFCAAQAPYIRERRWCKKQQMEILDDGTVILTLHTSGWYDVKKWLLSFGANAEILEPDEKRKEVQEEIKRMASQYTKKGRSSKNNHV